MYKVRFVKISCLQCQDCLELIPSRRDCLEVMSTRSGLFRGRVVK